MKKKSGLSWYGLIIFLIFSFNLMQSLSKHDVSLLDVVLFLFGVFVLVVFHLIHKEDE